MKSHSTFFSQCREEILDVVKENMEEVEKLIKIQDWEATKKEDKMVRKV